jgi:hypothetical protein
MTNDIEQPTSEDAQATLEWFNEIIDLIQQGMIESSGYIDFDEEDVISIKTIRKALMQYQETPPKGD